jgi:hypothetical protein
MTTMALTVSAIRRMLKDTPVEDPLAVAVTDTTTPTISVTDIGLYGAGQVVETDDGTDSAEQFYIRSVDTVNTQIVVKRGHNGSTAATHSLATPILIKPRFPYDEVAQAVNTTLDVDLYANDVFDVVEHAITSSAISDTYDKPTTECLKPLSVAQRVTATEEPTYLTKFNRRYYNADPSVFPTGGYIVFSGNYGLAGTDLYYLNCAHKFTIGTLTEGPERGVQMMACAYLLTWEDIRRTAGPVNQGDRTVRPLDSSRLGAAFFREQAMRVFRDEAAQIKQTLYPSTKRFVRGDIH